MDDRHTEQRTAAHADVDAWALPSDPRTEPVTGARFARSRPEDPEPQAPEAVDAIDAQILAGLVSP